MSPFLLMSFSLTHRIMPRKYVKKLGSVKGIYDDGALANAVEAVRTGRLSLRQAQEEFGVKKDRISRTLRGKHMKKYGGQTILTAEEETILVDRLALLAEWGQPLSLFDVRIFVKSYLDHKGRNVAKFSNNCPGKDWADGFLTRHKAALSVRFAQNIKRARAQVGPDEVKEYFAELAKSVEGVPPENIVNYDETNLTDNPTAKKKIFRRGTRHPDRIMNTTKSSISLMFAGTASGELLPPYVVYKADNLWTTWTEGGPPGTRYNRTKSGWFDSRTFADWFETIVVPFLRERQGRKLLIGDNLASHLTPHVVQRCSEMDIRFVFLPKNSTHLCQPLDVSFFRPMKMAWSNILEEYKAKNRAGSTVAKDKFPGLLRKLKDKLAPNASRNLQSGFRKCGIHPLAPNEVLSQLPGGHEQPERGDAADVGADVDASLIRYLHEARYGDENATARRKRRRLDVVPGRSIAQGPEDSSEEESNRSRNQSDTESSGSGELDDPADDDDLAGNTESADPPVRAHCAAIPRNIDPSDEVGESSERQHIEGVVPIRIGELRVSDFVLATVLGKTTKKIFVAQVISIDSDDTKVVYLKQTGKLSFVFPVVEDAGLVLQQDLLGKIVDIKPDRRGTTWTVPFDILAIW